MTELEGLLEAAMVGVWERIKGDPGEVARRLARRELATLARPARAACVVLRADDTRLDEGGAAWGGTGSGVGVNERAMRDGRSAKAYAQWMAGARERGEVSVRQEIGVTREMLVRMSAPVSFKGPIDVTEAARRLGVSENTIRKLAVPIGRAAGEGVRCAGAGGRNGRGRVGGGGARGGARGGRGAGGVVGRKVFYTVDARGEVGILPHQAEAVAWAGRNGVGLDSEAAKRYARGPRRVLVEPIERGAVFDPCSRKVGSSTDPAYGTLWRWNAEKVPAGFGQRVVRERVKVQSRRHGSSAARAAAWEGPERERLRAEEGRAEPGGWRFVCGGCGRRVRLLYLPVKLWTLPEWLGLGVKLGQGEGGVLACAGCHRVDLTPVVSGRVCWNNFVGRVSGGLLYGSEVERPGWLVAWRERAAGRVLARSDTGKRRGGRGVGVQVESGAGA